MHIRNIFKISKINFGALIYEKYRNNKFMLKICKFISNRTLNKLIKNSTLKCVKFDYLNEVNQSTHPDILFPSKIFKDKYLLTVSGYPFNLGRFENQYMFIGEDGINFFNVAQNEAIVTYLGTGKSHYSDGEILEFDNKLYLYYRMCYEDCENPYNIICYKTTQNLTDWSHEISVYYGVGATHLSPSIIHRNNIFYMYYVDCLDSCNLIKRIEDDNPNFSNKPQEEILALHNAPKDKQIWHLDVVANDDKELLGLFVFTEGTKGEATSLYYANSIDNGLNWYIRGEVKLDIDLNLVKRVYRASMIKKDNKWDIYVPVCTKNNCWFLLLKKNYELI